MEYPTKTTADLMGDVIETINRLAHTLSGAKCKPSVDACPSRSLLSPAFNGAEFNGLKITDCVKPTMVAIMNLKYYIYGKYYQSCLHSEKLDSAYLDADQYQRVERIGCIISRMVNVCDSALRDVEMLRRI